MCAAMLTAIGVNSKMNNISISQIQQLEMKMHKLVERIGQLEYANQALTQRVAELENQTETTEA